MKTKPTSLQALSPLGTISGVVATKRRREAFIRRRYHEVSPSPSQVLWQAAFRQVDSAWPLLSAADKNAWDAYRTWEHLSGYLQFMKANISRVFHGLPLLTNPSMIP